jgi:hypothetical protein
MRSEDFICRGSDGVTRHESKPLNGIFCQHHTRLTSHADTYIYTYMYLHIHVCICIYMHAYIYICTYLGFASGGHENAESSVATNSSFVIACSFRAADHCENRSLSACDSGTSVTTGFEVFTYGWTEFEFLTYYERIRVFHLWLAWLRHIGHDGIRVFNRWLA